MTMPIKGVVIVPAHNSQAAPGESPGTERIANRPIVCHALDSLLTAGTTRLAVVAGPGDIAAIRACVETDFDSGSVTFLSQDGHPDMLGALQTAATFAGEDPTVAHLATGLLGQSLAPFTQRLAADAPDLLMLLHHGKDEAERLGAATETLLGVTELNESRSRLSVTGVCLFGPRTLRRAADAPRERTEAVELVEVAETLAGDGRVVEAGIVSAWRQYSGDPLDLLELNRLVLDQQMPEPDHLPPGDNRIEGRVVIHPSAEVTSSVILGPSIIGPEARVSNSYIGPYTSIGPRSLIEGAEVVRSIVSEGVRIMHVGARIEGSTIGPRATIFRDFSLPRAMRLHVGEGVQVGLD